MKHYFFIIILSFTVTSFAAEDVHGLTVDYVYQFDHSNSTVFDINIPSRPHSCGSTLYRSYSGSDAIASRKFSLVLTAFTSGKKISFHDTGVCEGSRVKVSWIRITN